MKNIILDRINEEGGYILSSHQDKLDGGIYIIFKRIKPPEMVISVNGYDDNKIYGDAESKIVWLEEFIKENDLENKFKRFLMYRKDYLEDIGKRAKK